MTKTGMEDACKRQPLCTWKTSSAMDSHTPARNGQFARCSETKLPYGGVVQEAWCGLQWPTWTDGPDAVTPTDERRKVGRPATGSARRVQSGRTETTLVCPHAGPTCAKTIQQGMVRGASLRRSRRLIEVQPTATSSHAGQQAQAHDEASATIAPHEPAPPKTGVPAVCCPGEGQR